LRNRSTGGTSANQSVSAIAKSGGGFRNYSPKLGAGQPLAFQMCSNRSRPFSAATLMARDVHRVFFDAGVENIVRAHVGRRRQADEEMTLQRFLISTNWPAQLSALNFARKRL